jgi:hypothetical protein
LILLPAVGAEVRPALPQDLRRVLDAFAIDLHAAVAGAVALMPREQ